MGGRYRWLKIVSAVFLAFFIVKSPIAAGTTFNHLLAGLSSAGTSLATFLSTVGK